MQTYRRGAAFLCMLCLVFCTCIVTAAQEPYDCFERLEDYPDDLAQIQALDYLTPINGAIEMMGQTPLPEDTAMDFSSAIRVYDCPALFSANTDSKAAVVSQLQNSSPMYLYAFTHQQRVYYLTFSIGKPVWEPARDVMTSSEISEVEQNEGKWILDTVGTSDQDYIAVNALGELESRLQTLDLQDTVYLCLLYTSRCV